MSVTWKLLTPFPLKLRMNSNVWITFWQKTWNLGTCKNNSSISMILPFVTTAPLKRKNMSESKGKPTRLFFLWFKYPDALSWEPQIFKSWFHIFQTLRDATLFIPYFVIIVLFYKIYPTFSYLQWNLTHIVKQIVLLFNKKSFQKFRH